MTILCPECRRVNTQDSQFCKFCGVQITGPEISASQTETIMGPPAEREQEKKELIAGRYRILSSLGRGGMGEVFKVRDTKLQEDIALKVLNPGVASDPAVIERFRNELKLARKITHKNICRVFDFHEEEGRPFITMEYVQGEDLKTRIRSQGRLREAEALAVAEQVAEGLIEAHKLSVVHRDLKPQNVMIGPDDRVKIMDFGIARSPGDSSLTQTGQMVGTPDYFSPEQAAGLPADHRADIYALGVMLYEMTTGSLPFKGDTALSLITKHRETAAKNPREINPEISEGLSRLIMRCLEKDRERRYQSARELQEDLTGLLAGKIPKAAPKPARRGLFGGRRWILPSGAAALTVILAVVFLWRIRGPGSPSSSGPEKPSLGVVYFENNTGQESLDHWRKAFAELLTADLSQSKYLNVLPGDRMYEILSGLGRVEAPSFSSDILRRVAQKGRIRHILRGSYSKAGAKFRVSVFLQDTRTGEQVSVRTAEADSEEGLFVLVDELTREIKSDMNLTPEQIRGDIDEGVADVTSSYPEAYTFFVQGLRHHYRAEYQRCIEFMDRAIAIDPEFAAAYTWKAWSYESAGYYPEFVTSLTKAYELSHRVSERERFRVTGYYYMRIKNDIPRALEELQRFVSLYPEDMEANHQLGFLHIQYLDEYEKGVAFLRRNVENRTEIFYPYYLLAQGEMCLGDYDRAQDVCEQFFSEVGDHPEMRFILAINFFCRGDYDRALEEAGNVVKLGYSVSYWNNLFQGAILEANGDLDGAEKNYRDMAGSRDVLVGAMGREQLGLLALLRGRFKEAGKQFEQAIELHVAAKDETSLSRLYVHLAYASLRAGEYEACLRAVSKAQEIGQKSMFPVSSVKLAVHLKGLAQLAAERSSEALGTAQELKALSEKDPSRFAMRDYLHLTGKVELEKGEIGQGIRHLEEAVSLMPAQNQEDLAGFRTTLYRTLFMASLADAYFRAGDMNKARQAYEAITRLTIGRHHWADLYVHAYFRLGQIAERQGKPADAAASYRIFLNLWDQADAGIPEPAKAKERLEALAD